VQTCARLIGLGQLAKEHGDKLLPAGEALGVPIAGVFANQPGEGGAINQAQHLTEEAD
jgi:hypothetical protein